MDRMRKGRRGAGRRGAEIRRCGPTMVRSSGIGFFLGLLPGCAPAVTTFIAYDVEKRISKTPERFGKGAIEGVAAPEGANNATSSAGFFMALALASIGRGIWLQVRSHAPEIAIDGADE